jgi:hypothetical protein
MDIRNSYNRTLLYTTFKTGKRNEAELENLIVLKAIDNKICVEEYFK